MAWRNLVRAIKPAGLALAMLLLPGAVAQARVLITIDKSSQRMTVAVDGATRHVFTVSTGRTGFGTPNGHFRPQRMARSWFSRKYYNSPMPHSIFFHGGYAIHGSSEISRLGGPASHGCVRLHPANAAALFALVSREGASRTRIVVTGGTSRMARSRLDARARLMRPPSRDLMFSRPAYRPTYPARFDEPEYLVPPPYRGRIYYYVPAD